MLLLLQSAKLVVPSLQSINLIQFMGKIVNLTGNMAYTLGLLFVFLPATEQLLFAFDINAVSCHCISNLK